jgi:CHAT domain-containing protein/tetratricopeptide (TPR) repeat protein
MAAVEQGLRGADCADCGEWLWRFRLLGAEISIERREPAEALARVDAPMPPALERGTLAARREKVRAHASFNLHRLDEAERHAQVAAGLVEQASDPNLRAELLTLQHRLLDARGRAADAEALNQQAIDLSRSIEDSYQLAIALNDRGWRRFTAERWAEALPLFEQAAGQAHLIGADFLAGFIELNVGICLYRLGDFEGARRRFVESSAAFERLGLPERLADSVGEVGNSYIQAGDPERALPHYQRALALSRGHSPASVALWAGSLADALLQLRRWDEAGRLNDEALTSARAYNDKTTVQYLQMIAAHIEAGRGDLGRAEASFRALLDSPDAPLVLRWEAEAGLGDICARQGRVNEADHYFARAIARVEEARRDRTDVEHRTTTFLNGLIRLHRQYVDWLVGQGRSEEALRVVERGRTRVLSERLDRRPEPPDDAALDLRAKARLRGEVLVSYWIAPVRSYAWVITGSSVRLIRLPGEEQLQPLVESYRGVLENSLRDPLTGARSPGRELYRLLVAPWVPELPADARVTIAPDGPLHALPFPALIVEGERPHYWLEDVTIAVAPSLAALPEAPGAAAGPPSVLAIGDPEADGVGFPALPFAGAELEALERHFGAAAVTGRRGSAARPEAYLEGRPNRFSIVHFAAHAVANPGSPLDSNIVLSPGQHGRRLAVRDVLEVPLTATLVTVSACRGVGTRAYSGVGMVGFAWGFLTAGARQVVAGLWDVADRSTATLMDRMYAGMAGGLDAPAALRRAQLELAASPGPQRLPFHWAAFSAFLGPGGNPHRPL